MIFYQLTSKCFAQNGRHKDRLPKEGKFEEGKSPHMTPKEFYSEMFTKLGVTKVTTPGPSDSQNGMNKIGLSPKTQYNGFYSQIPIIPSPIYDKDMKYKSDSDDSRVSNISLPRFTGTCEQMQNLPNQLMNTPGGTPLSIGQNLTLSPLRRSPIPQGSAQASPLRPTPINQSPSHQIPFSPCIGHILVHHSPLRQIPVLNNPLNAGAFTPVALSPKNAVDLPPLISNGKCESMSIDLMPNSATYAGVN
jgi:hypothetical protein